MFGVRFHYKQYQYTNNPTHIIPYQQPQPSQHDRYSQYKVDKLYAAFKEISDIMTYHQLQPLTQSPKRDLLHIHPPSTQPSSKRNRTSVTDTQNL